MPESREVEYWEDQANQKVTDDGVVRDNVFKRPEQLKRLLKYNWIGENVLEVGHGNAMIAGALKVSVQAKWNYIGTELSPKFQKHAKAAFNLRSEQLDITELHQLPHRGEFTRIIAFDSFEHVKPSDREIGYQQVSSMAAKGALLFIHYSDSPCSHDPEFDHPFGLDDLLALQDVGFKLNSFERYEGYNPAGNLNLVFLVMEKA